MFLDVFMMVTLLDLPENLQQNVDQASVRAAPHPFDVIMLVKRYIGSESLSQRPLLVLTSQRSSRVGLVPQPKYHHLN